MVVSLHCYPSWALKICETAFLHRSISYVIYSTQSLTDDIQNEEGSSLSQEQSQHAPSPRILPPPPQIVQVIPKPVSVQNSSFTVSSSTTVGTSMFDGISEGERLCSDDVIPGLYSEGEFPLSEGQALDFLLEEGDGGNFSHLTPLNVSGATPINSP